ncbi:MAG TPA: hypothetical protein VGB64_02705 [Actinomycetota bacterium]
MTTVAREGSRAVFWLGLLSFVVAALSYALMWSGGLLALPVSTLLAIAALWRAWSRHERSSWTRAGVVAAAIVLLVGIFTYAGAIVTT